MLILLPWLWWCPLVVGVTIASRVGENNRRLREYCETHCTIAMAQQEPHKIRRCFFSPEQRHLETPRLVGSEVENSSRPSSLAGPALLGVESTLKAEMHN